MFAVGAICPIFSADNDSSSSEKEGIVESLFGPGSLASACCESLTTKPGLWGLVAANALVTGVALRYPNIGREIYFYIPFGVQGTLVALESLDLCLIRDIQKARANKAVNNEKIKGYISELLDNCSETNPFSLRRMKPHPVAESSRMTFLKHYQQERLLQLQICADEVLLEKGLCKKTNNGEIKWTGKDIQFDLLREILQNNKNEDDAAENNYENMQGSLNLLLGYCAGSKNRKPARR